MVFFCCDGCGETFKKARVDAHAAKCRECYAVSCVDCSQSFPGDEYRNHTSCISEAERYEKSIYRGTRKLDDSGTGHRQHQQKSKKLTPQEAWNQTIEIAAETAPPALKSYVGQLTMQENVPRKQKQFGNFAANSLRLKGPGGTKTIGDIWALLSKVREEEKQKKLDEEKKKKEKKEEEETKPDSPNNSKDNAASVSDDNTGEDAAELPSEKKVSKEIRKALKQAPNKQMKIKAVRKHVQKSFKADKAAKDQWKKLVQQCIDANPKRLVVDGKTVTLAK